MPFASGQRAITPTMDGPYPCALAPCRGPTSELKIFHEAVDRKFPSLLLEAARCARAALGAPPVARDSNSQLTTKREVREMKAAHPKAVVILLVAALLGVGS